MAEKRIFQYLYLIIVICVGLYFIPPKLSVWINNRGVQAFNEKKIKEAIGLYKKSIKIHPNAQTYYNLGCAWKSIGEKNKAIVEFQRCIQKDPKYTKAYEAVISIYRQERDYEQAEFYANTLQALDKGNKLLQGFKDKQVVNLYNQGVIFYKTGQLKKAKARFQEVLNLEPSFSKALIMLGEINFKQRNFYHALSYYNETLKAGISDNPAVYNNMGIIYMNLEEYDKALIYLKRARYIDPDNQEIAYNLASALRDNGNFKKALKLYQKITAQDDYYPNIHNDIGGIFEALGNHEQAVNEYKKELDIADSLLSQGAKDKAIFVRKALSLNGLGKTQEAKEILDDVIKNNLAYRKAYFARAQIYEKSGEIKAGDEDLEIAKNLNRPKDAPENFPETPKEPVAAENSLQPKEQKKENIFKNDIKIILKNGQTIQARLKYETDKKIVIEIQSGASVSTISFSKSKIAEIERI